MKPKKRYGQNFLINQSIAKTIVEKSEIDNKVVIEIGPGKGALTSLLIKEAKYVYAFEIDLAFKPLLQKLSLNNRLKVIYEDILQVDLNKLIKNNELQGIICVANIPYNITGPILTKLSAIPEIKSLVLMVQKEVGQRLLATPNNKSYGQLTVIYNYLYTISKVIDVKKTNFYPIPKVDSMVIKMDRITTYQKLVKNETNFIEFVKASFTQKRKTLINNLKAYYRLTTEQVKEKLFQIDHNFSTFTRAEGLDIKTFIKLANRWYNDWKSLCKIKFNIRSYR